MSQFTDFLKTVTTPSGEIPFVKDLWGFFSSKGKKTVFFTVNPDESFTLDLDICEGLGCPIRVLTNKESIVARWDKVSTTLKNRAIAEEDKELTWLAGVDKRWILPRNLIIQQTQFSWSTLATEVAALPDQRVDLLKIEGKSEEERMFLYSLLDGGFRPGLMLIRWTEDPDAHVPAMMAAAHLQMSGYRLLETKGQWFLYMFDDVCVYESCSWRNSTVQNPVVTYLSELFSPKKTAKSTNETSVAKVEE
jgi:hypothetical protein